jgi:hypothetical protein
MSRTTFLHIPYVVCVYTGCFLMLYAYTQDVSLCCMRIHRVFPYVVCVYTGCFLMLYAYTQGVSKIP